MKPIVFRKKGNKKEFLWLLVYLAFIGVCIWVLAKQQTFRIKDYLICVMTVLICGVGAYFSLRFSVFTEAVLKLLPEGIRGNTNFHRMYLIPWEHICSVKLETDHGRKVVGVYTDWPHGIPMEWKHISGSQRREVWKRCNRKQAPLILYIDFAAASPETILHTIQQELERARQRGLAPREPEEGGT